MQPATRTTCVATILLLLAPISFAGCRGVYYDAWESLEAERFIDPMPS
jgi:hypothetical protein